MTREEAFKIQSQFKDALHIFDDIHPNAKAYFLAEGVLSGFEQSVRASISNISEMRHLDITLKKIDDIIFSGYADKIYKSEALDISLQLSKDQQTIKDFREALEEIKQHGARCEKVKCVCCPWEATMAKQVLSKHPEKQ